MDNKWVIELHSLSRWSIAHERNFFRKCDFMIPMTPRTLEECVPAFIQRHQHATLLSSVWRFRNIITGDILPAELL